MHPTRTAEIVIPLVRAGDATGQHAIDLATVLQRNQYSVQIFCHENAQSIPPVIQSIVRPIHASAYRPSSDLTIVEYAVWSPLIQQIAFATGAVLFWYQGVTPPAFWDSKSEIEMSQLSQEMSRMVWHAQLAVCASPFTRQELHDNTGFPLERMRVVPLSVDVEKFAQPLPAPQQAELRRQHGIEGKRVLLYVGRIAGNKRIDLLIDALAHLASDHPDLHLLIVGDDSSHNAAAELANTLRNQADRLGLTGRVTFTGKVPSVEPYYHLADILVHASQHEGFCVPLIEAMAAGKPIIASRSGSMPWVLNAEAGDALQTEHAAGLTFAPGDAAALAAQIDRMLRDTTLRTKLIEAGRQRVKYFTPQHFEQRVMALCQETLAVAQQTPPVVNHLQHLHYPAADIALHGHQVRSNLPVIGRLVAWLRKQSTSHVKEAYLDRIILRQIEYNRTVANEIGRLQNEVADLRQQLQKR